MMFFEPQFTNTEEVEEVKRYTADFETTSEKQYLVDGFTRVWAVNVTDITTLEHAHTSTNLEEFFAWLKKSNHKNENKEIYFHNLKFDGVFIVTHLLTNGFTHSLDKSLNPNEFSTLITDMGVWYEIKICFNVYDKRKNQVIIRDSYKKLPFSVRRVAEAFKLDIKKGTINYDEYREKTHNLTCDELEYLYNDTGIMAQALKTQFDKGLSKMTIGADALANFKEFIGKQNFDYLFPVLNNTIDRDIRGAYKGGYVYLQKQHKNIALINVISYDVNSLYPSVMYDRLLPYGEPIYFQGEYVHDERYPLFIQVLSVELELKENHIPTLQVKNNPRFNDVEYITSTYNEPIILTLTSVDIKLMKEHYNITHIEFLEGFKFKGVSDLFVAYIDYWNNIKMKNIGALRELAKLMLNNLYGKFGTNPKKCGMIPSLDSDGTLLLKAGKTTYEKPTYTAMACYITAYAREVTISNAQKLYPYFIYADTDSLHLHNITTSEVEKILNVDDKKLGFWKYEGLAEKAKFLRAKTYIKIKDVDGTKTNFITCAGLPESARDNVTFDNFTYKASYGGKLSQKRVQGGAILKTIDFTIKANN